MATEYPWHEHLVNWEVFTESPTEFIFMNATRIVCTLTNYVDYQADTVRPITLLQAMENVHESCRRDGLELCRPFPVSRDGNLNSAPCYVC